MPTPSDMLLGMLQAAFPDQSERERIAAIIQSLESSSTIDGRRMVVPQGDSTATVRVGRTIARIDNLAETLYGIAQRCDRHVWYTEAEQLLRIILVLQERALQPKHPDIATILNDLAGILAITKRMHQALLHMDRAVAISERMLGEHYADTIIYRANRDFLRERLGEAGG